VAGNPGFWVNLYPKGQPLPPQHKGFLDGLLILNVDPTMKTSELLWPVQNPNCTKVSLADINPLLVVGFYIRPWGCSQLVNWKKYENTYNI
jgi:hypothetical protein